MPVQPQKQFIPFYMLEIPFRPHKFLCFSALVSNLPCQPGEELVWGASAVEAEEIRPGSSGAAYICSGRFRSEML